MNKIKVHALNTRLFKQLLCNEYGEACERMFFHTEVRCFQRETALHDLTHCKILSGIPTKL